MPWLFRKGPHYNNPNLLIFPNLRGDLLDAIRRVNVHLGKLAQQVVQPNTARLSRGVFLYQGYPAKGGQVVDNGLL